MCPNTEFFLVRIFPHSDWIRRDTKYLFVFSSNAGKYGPEKTPYLSTFHTVTFFSNIVIKLKIEGYSNCEPLTINISDSVLKCILKYRNHPRILTIGKIYNKKTFPFSKIQRGKVLIGVLKLETNKACQSTGISTKIVKENTDIVANDLFSNFNNSIEKPHFPSILKNSNITPVFKNGHKNSKSN